MKTKDSAQHQGNLWRSWTSETSNIRTQNQGTQTTFFTPKTWHHTHPSKTTATPTLLKAMGLPE
jgi:hypothetical protein